MKRGLKTLTLSLQGGNFRTLDIFSDFYFNNISMYKISKLPSKSMKMYGNFLSFLSFHHFIQPLAQPKA